MRLEKIKILETDTVESALKNTRRSVKALIVVNKKNKLLGILNDANIEDVLSGASCTQKSKILYEKKRYIFCI